MISELNEIVSQPEALRGFLQGKKRQSVCFTDAMLSFFS